MQPKLLAAALVAALLALGVLTTSCRSGDAGAVTGEAVAAPPDRPVELGRVRWERDFDAAVERARRTDRDLLLLFQEVPG